MDEEDIGGGHVDHHEEHENLSNSNQILIILFLLDYISYKYTPVITLNELINKSHPFVVQQAS